MKNVEKDVQVKYKYERLLIKICKDLNVKNYKEIIKDYLNENN